MSFLLEPFHISQLKIQPLMMINIVTVPKNMAISFHVITFLSIVASGNDRPTTAIIKAMAVPRGMPLATNTSIMGTWAAANRCWLSTSYRVIVNYWRLFYDTFCTFLHAHGNDNVFLRQKNLFLCHIFNVWFYNKLLDSGLTIVNCKCFMYSIEPKPPETLCKLCLQS